MQQRTDDTGPFDRRDPVLRNVGRKAEVELKPERDGDLLGEEAPEGALAGVDPPFCANSGQ